MSGINISGTFHFKSSDGNVIAENEITDAGVNRILDLIAGRSFERWSRIRLTLDDVDSTTATRRARIEREDNRVKSTATFRAADIPGNIVQVDMIAGDTVVASADTFVDGNRTIIVERFDEVAKG